MDIYAIKKKTNETKHFKCIYDFIVYAWGKDLLDYIIVVSTKQGEIILPSKMVGGNLDDIQAFLLCLCS